MKPLIVIAALTLAASAPAEIIASQPNLDGGRIVLTDDAVQGCKGSFAYSYAASGSVTKGCWSHIDSIKAARILWEDGTIGVYPSNTFQLSPYGVDRYIRPGLEKSDPSIHPLSGARRAGRHPLSAAAFQEGVST